MKTSTYINSLIKDLSNHLWQASDRERNSYHQAYHNLTYGQNVSYKSQHIRDLINFYINELEFTPGQFIGALNDNSRLIDTLYSSYMSYISDRRELQKIFEPVIRKDIDLFIMAIKKCLETHHNLYESVQHEPTNKDLLAQVERNTEDFKILLEIGEEENFFHKIPKNCLYTKNSKYKQLIQEKGLLENEAFDEKKLIELFKEAGFNRRGVTSLGKVAEYSLFYIKDVVEKFDSPGSFNAWAATHVNTERNKDGNLIEIITDKNFFSLITKDVNDESKPHQDKFIDQWLNNISFRQQISLGYNSNLAFLKSHPHKITDFLDKLTSKEKVDMLNKGIGDSDFERSHYDFRAFLDGISLESASPLIHSSIIEKLMDFRKEPRHSEDVMADNAFFSAALNHLVAKSLKITQASSLSDEEKEKAKKEILNSYLKNKDIIVSMIHQASNAINKNIHNLESNLNELKLNKRELGLSSQFFDDLESLASHKVEMYFNHKSDKNTYNYMTNLVEGIRNSVNVVSTLGIYSTLDKFNLFDIKINKEKRIQRNKRGKYFDDYPAIFEIVEHTQAKDKGIINWILQEKHLPLLKEATLYKNKNIIEFFSSFEDLNGNIKTPIIEVLFEEMMKNKVVFKELVLSKRKTLNSIKDLKSDFIQTSLNMMSLDKDLSNKEEPVKKITKKI